MVYNTALKSFLWAANLTVQGVSKILISIGVAVQSQVELTLETVGYEEYNDRSALLYRVKAPVIREALNVVAIVGNMIGRSWNYMQRLYK